MYGILFSVALALSHWAVAETILSWSCHCKDHDAGGGRGKDITRNESMVEADLLPLCAQIHFGKS